MRYVVSFTAALSPNNVVLSYHQKSATTPAATKESAVSASASAPKVEEKTDSFDPQSSEAQELYRLLEQRKRMIEMRIQPGSHQESGLKELESLLLQIHAEIDILQTNKSKDKFRKECSILIKSGEMMSVGKLLSLLSQKRLEVQEKVSVSCMRKITCI